ncbi:MAG: hypothetical protein LBI92_03080 [Azoarcus sp.]|jgi:hypothetical protein|nr:hypothetical protein [Azoarcus sp.]
MASSTVLPAALPTRGGDVQRAPTNRRHAQRARKLNRVAKAGMLLSLAASLAFAAGGKRRAHVVSGGVFVACLGLHLWHHRNRMMR